jgi:hypothetical protein
MCYKHLSTLSAFSVFKLGEVTVISVTGNDVIDSGLQLSLLNIVVQYGNFGQLHQMLLYCADLANMETSSLLNLMSLPWGINSQKSLIK